MSDIPRAPTALELAEHQHSLFTFERLVLVAVMHVVLTLSCAALVFIGHIHVLALLLWLGGTVILFSGLAMTSDRFVR